MNASTIMIRYRIDRIFDTVLQREDFISYLSLESNSTSSVA